MTLPITKEQAIELLDKYDPERKDFMHYIESEAIMKKLAQKLGEDEEYWAMLGLLHDVDWGLVRDNPSEHLSKTSEILKEAGFDDEFIETIISHGYGFDILPQWKDKKRTTKAQHALTAAETVTGIVYAYALMRGKKISDMEVKGLKKKFKDKRFAANCNRDIIKECEEIGLNIDEFLELSIEALKEIKEDIGLE